MINEIEVLGWLFDELRRELVYGFFLLWLWILFVFCFFKWFRLIYGLDIIVFYWDEWVLGDVIGEIFCDLMRG